jgi:phage I-like protein
MSDETTQKTDVTVDTGEPTAIDNKEPALVPSHRLKEEADKRREAETKLAEYESKFAETETQIQQAKLEAERTYAKEMYGDYVEDPAVQEYKTKYPDLSYKQIFGALEIELPTNH